MCSSQERSNWCNYMLKCHLRLGIENLPCELQRNFTLMRDLDNRTEGDHLNHVYQFFYLHVGFQDLPKLATCCCMIVSWIMIVGLLLRFQVTHPRSARNWMQAWLKLCWNDAKKISKYDLLPEKKVEINKLAEEYVAKVKNLASEQRVEHLQKIQSAYSKCKEFSDDKVQLAMQTYEMVGPKHVRFSHQAFFLSVCFLKNYYY